MKNKIMLLAFISIICFSCSQNEVLPDQVEKKQLVGEENLRRATPAEIDSAVAGAKDVSNTGSTQQIEDGKPVLSPAIKALASKRF